MAILSTNKKINSRINSWKPSSANQVFVEQDGKLFVCHFDRIFGAENLSIYNRFIISKASYENQLERIVGYTNFFINHYDRDLELVTAYLKMKFIIDKEKIFDNNSIDGFIDMLYEIIFTKSIVEKIKLLVEENYLDDIETDSEKDSNKKKYTKFEKKHLESLEFNNDHIKVLLAISFGMKIMSPVMFHFIKLNNIDIGKETDTIYQFYKKLFDIFGYGTNYSLFDDKNRMLVEEIPREQVEEEVDMMSLQRVEDGYTYRYYTTKVLSDGKAHKVYYTPLKILMFNKLFLYV